MSVALNLRIKLDQYAAIDPSLPHWFDCVGFEPSYSYCRSCAYEIAAQADVRDDDGPINFGCAGESDGCMHCELCGVVLDYILTDYGASCEIEHFSTARFRTPLGREEAYHIARMIGALGDDTEAVRIAERAVKAIPAIARQHKGGGES